MGWDFDYPLRYNKLGRAGVGEVSKDNERRPNRNGRKSIPVIGHSRASAGQHLICKKTPHH